MKLKDALLESYKKIEVTTKEGYALGEYDSDTEEVELKIITTNPEYRGKGKSRSIMNKFIEKAKKYGAVSIVLSVEAVGTDGLSDEQLTKYYESFGFKTTRGNHMKLKLY